VEDVSRGRSPVLDFHQFNVNQNLILLELICFNLIESHLFPNPVQLVIKVADRVGYLKEISPAKRVLDPLVSPTSLNGREERVEFELVYEIRARAQEELGVKVEGVL